MEVLEMLVDVLEASMEVFIVLEAAMEAIENFRGRGVSFHGSCASLT